MSAVALGHAEGGIHRRTIRRERVAQAVLAEMAHALDGAQELVGRAGHQQLIVRDATVAALGIAGKRQRGLAVPPTPPPPNPPAPPPPSPSTPPPLAAPPH